MEGDVRRAILLVDHGSKREEANRQLDRLAAAVREKSPSEIVEFAHMEIAAPSIADGIARCVDGGAELIVVHPFFLGPGRHTQQSIPELVAAAATHHPGIEIRISEPFGAHPGLIDSVLDWLREVD